MRTGKGHRLYLLLENTVVCNPIINQGHAVYITLYEQEAYLPTLNPCSSHSCN